MSTASPITHALLALIRSALGLAGTPAGGCADVKENPVVDWNALSEADWQEILQMARKQTVTGLLFRGVANLPAEVQVPDSLLFPLMEETDRIRRQSWLVARTAKEITEFFEGRILHPVILKGPSVACFYPEPDLRESGDIDLYFNEKEFGKAVHAIRERLQRSAPEAQGLTTLPDGSVHYKWNGIDIDQHARYFDLSGVEGLPSVPSPEATLLMLSAHILKHSMGTGIGLRQLCDMAMAYERIPYDRARLLACYEATGTADWNRLLASFLIRYLGATRTPYTSATERQTAGTVDPGLPDPAPLLDIVLGGGNFGHHEASREKALQAGPLQRKLDTARRFLGRLPFSLRYGSRQLAHYLKNLIKGNLS